MDVTVKDDERAFLFRDGRFVDLLGPGRHQKSSWRSRLSVELVKVVQAEIVLEKAQLIAKTHPEIAKQHFEFVQASSTEVGVVSLDGYPTYTVLPNTTRVFWKTLTNVQAELFDIAADIRAPKRFVDMMFERSKTISHVIVEAHEVGLLFIDGEFKEQLGPGRHAFWAVERTIRIAKIDLRPQPLEVTAQEILTKDRVSIRVTLTAFTKITDPVKAMLAAADTQNTLYRLIQFAIREAVAARTLDEILAARDTIDNEVRAYVSERATALGAEVGEIGVKDVILPGEIRDLLNKVVEAEKIAKANLIRRQEETAATRSLLNTSKLMENNPLLLRLKELEALEKLVEKVGRIDLHTGAGAGGFDALLSNLFKLGAGDKERPAN